MNRRIIRTALFSGMLALAVSPFASLAVANAKPADDYQACMQKPGNDMLHCCIEVGGTYTWESPQGPYHVESEVCVMPDAGLSAENTGGPSAPPKPRPAKPVVVAPLQVG